MYFSVAECIETDCEEMGAIAFTCYIDRKLGGRHSIFIVIDMLFWILILIHIYSDNEDTMHLNTIVSFPLISTINMFLVLMQVCVFLWAECLGADCEGMGAIAVMGLIDRKLSIVILVHSYGF